MSQRIPRSLTVVPGEEILMQRERVWYYGGDPSFNKVALGHLIITDKKILFFEQKTVALSQLLSDVSTETLGLAFTVPLDMLKSAKIETRVRSRGSRPVWRDASVYRKIVSGRRPVNKPAGMLDRKERYFVLIISVNRGKNMVDNLVFEVANPLDWIMVLKKQRETIKEEVAKSVTAYDAERIGTGVKVLDGLLNGGIPSGYGVLLTSPSCDERDILIQRFLKRVAEDGGVAIYACVDPAKTLSLAKMYPSNIHVLACNPRTEVLPKDMPNLHSISGLENLSDINIGLLKVLDSLTDKDVPKPERAVCMDMISEVLLQHKILNTRRWLLDILPRVKFKEYTILATLNPYMHSPEETQAVVDIFDGEISLYQEEGTNLKYIQVKKMFNLDYSSKAVPLDRRAMQT